MELRQHASVLWRWRRIVGIGAGLALLMALLVTFKPTWDGGPGIGWRDSETFSSTSTLFVTQPGFPWGRVILPTAPDGSPAPAQPAKDGRPATPAFASPERFGDLALLYAYLGNSQQVRALIAPRPAEDRIAIQPIQDPVTDTGLPLLQLTTTAHGATGAVQLNTAVIAALRTYLARQQTANAIPATERVEVQVIEPPARAKLLEGRSAAAPVLAFLLTLAAAIGVAYILENLRRGREEEPERQAPATRGSTVVMAWSETPVPAPAAAPAEAEPPAKPRPARRPRGTRAKPKQPAAEGTGAQG